MRKGGVQKNGDIITVTSVLPSGARPAFATPGRYRAPGVNLNVTDGNGNKAPKMGTSLSAPQTATIVKNIYATLMRAPDWSQLAPRVQTAAVARVFSASGIKTNDRYGSQDVDGYRAMVLAQSVAKSGVRAFLNVADPEDYALEAFEAKRLRLLSSNPQLAKGSCTSTEKFVCEEISTCYSAKRKLLALSDMKSSDAIALRQDLTKTVNTTGNGYDLAQKWLDPDNLKLSSNGKVSGGG